MGRTSLHDTVKKIKAESVRYIHKETPWLAEDGVTLVWSFPRILASRIISQQSFEAFMGVLIMFNLGRICYETDYEAQCYPAYKDTLSTCPFKAGNVAWLKFSSNALLVL